MINTETKHCRLDACWYYSMLTKEWVFLEKEIDIHIKKVTEKEEETVIVTVYTPKNKTEAGLMGFADDLDEAIFRFLKERAILSLLPRRQSRHLQSVKV